MINLLPGDAKESYRYAALNQRLLKWVSAFVVALLGLGIIGTYGLLNLHQTNASLQSQVNESQQMLRSEHLAQTQKQAKEITNTMRLTVKVLSQEILFSKLLQQIGAVMPPGSVLTGLTISQLKGGIDLSAAATDYNAATQVQVNLQDPTNKIFTKADIISINCNPKSQDANQNTKYPCIVNIRALFADNNPYLFINQGKTKAGS